MKYLNKIYVIFLFLISAPSIHSTTFYPLPFSKQLIDSSGVVKAIFKGHTTKKLSNGQVVSEGSFHLLEVSGIASGEIINPKDFRVLYPGGVHEGLTYEVFGSPKFEPDEEVVLILSKKHGMYMVHNLGLGKYKVQKSRKETLLISEVFPDHPNIGKVDEKIFNEKVKEKFGTNLLTLDPAGYVKRSESASRDVASIEKDSPKRSEKIGVYWLVLLLMGLGLVSILLTNRE